MRSFKVEGIVIKRRNYGESDRIITVFTKYQGKLTIKASGVRKITSRRSAHIELLNHAMMTVHNASKYPVLTEVESMQNFSDIKSDLQRVGFAYHICELVDGLCPENEEHRQVFELLLKTLHQLSTPSSFWQATEERVQNPRQEDPGQARMTGLADGGSNLATVIHEFEVELLSLLGYWHGQPEMAAKLDTQNFIENIIERKLKSKRLFSKL